MLVGNLCAGTSLYFFINDLNFKEMNLKRVHKLYFRICLPTLKELHFKFTLAMSFSILKCISVFCKSHIETTRCLFLQCKHTQTFLLFVSVTVSSDDSIFDSVHADKHSEGLINCTASSVNLLC